MTTNPWYRLGALQDYVLATRMRNTNLTGVFHLLNLDRDVYGLPSLILQAGLLVPLALLLHLWLHSSDYGLDG